MTKSLIVTYAELEAHFRNAADTIGGCIGQSVVIDTDWLPPKMTGGLTGTCCEHVARNRGVRTPVAPFKKLGQDLWSWLSYREEWEVEAAAGSKRRFSYRSAGITVYFGMKNDPIKPQMFRSEWAGWAKWSTNYGFQASGAAHPHWQFDTLESLRHDSAKTAENLVAQLKEDDELVREFSPSTTQKDVRDLIRAQALSKMHFASAAAWWKLPPDDNHAHGPRSVIEVRRWLEKSLQYLSVELGRL